MSQEWLDFQSFFSDQKILKAITDLSLATKYDLAGIHDEERMILAAEAKKAVSEFLLRLNDACDQVSQGQLLSGDSRSRELVDALRYARRDRANYKSVLMQSGLRNGADLINANDRRSKEALVESLDELRRVLSRHQQGTLSSIIEDF